ncbi:hypothetical protein ACTQ49_12185 [Luteococcus sp. Sow4_B9]
MNKFIDALGKLVHAYPNAVLGDVAHRNPELFLSSQSIIGGLRRY